MWSLTRLRVAAVLLAVTFFVATLPIYRVLLTSQWNRWAIAALVLGLIAMMALGRAPRWVVSALLWPSRRVFLSVTSAVAVAISLWMIFNPIGNHVVGLDSSVYLMEARALSHLKLGAMPASPFPYSSVRFLFEGPSGALYGVFPVGFPLFLAPFVVLGWPLLAALVVAVLLVLAQYWLALEATEDEVAARAGVLLSLLSFARALETSDLMSHAFVAVASAGAVAAGLRLQRKPSVLLALALGGMVGWAVSARLLDGLVLAVFAFGLVAFAALKRRASPKLLVVAALAAAPFAVLVFAQQKVATGHWLRPTQSEFFLRSDYPATCHRLGFGPDVGCAVEHPRERKLFGPDGYGPRDAARVVSLRAAVLGLDLCGFAPLLMLAFAGTIRTAKPREVLLSAFVIALMLAYGLFYYGNSSLYGARHLFPAAPFLYTMLGRFITSLPWQRASAAEATAERAHVVGGALVALAVAMGVGLAGRWQGGLKELESSKIARTDLRKLVEELPPKSLLATTNVYSFIAAFDPVRDGDDRLLVLDDIAGLSEVRRTRPDWKVYSIPEGGSLQQLDLGAVPKTVSIELELAWPSLQRPTDMMAKQVSSIGGLNNLPASGGRALGILFAKPGSRLEVPFEMVEEGTYSLSLDGYVGPSFGRYEVLLDGAPWLLWEGGSSSYATKKSEPSAPMHLAKGRHVLEFRCVGRDPRSRDYSIAFDRLVAEPVSP